MQLTPLQQRITDARRSAGWTRDDGDQGIWFAPDGTGAEAWEAAGLPLPEDPDYDAYWHYEYLDSCT